MTATLRKQLGQSSGFTFLLPCSGPQFDYLPEFLTVKQTFKLFANLRGLELTTVDSVLNDFIQVFKLKEFEKKLVQDLRSVVCQRFIQRLKRFYLIKVLLQVEATSEK